MKSKQVAAWELYLVRALSSPAIMVWGLLMIIVLVVVVVAMIHAGKLLGFMVPLAMKALLTPSKPT
jgi:hypothetical protein